MIAAVLEVVPHTVDAPHQLIADGLILVNDVRPLAGQLNPPVAVVQAIAVKGLLPLAFLLLARRGAGRVGGKQQHGLVVAVAPELQIVLGEVPHPLRRPEGDRVAPVHRLKQQGVAHAVVVGLVRGVRLLELRLPLAAGAVVRPGEVAQRTVACAVDEHLSGNPQIGLRGTLVADDALDGVPFQLCVMHTGVQEQRQPLLPVDGLQQRTVPDRIIIVVIAGLVFQHDLVDDAGLRRVAFKLVGICAANVHPDLRAGVPAQYGPVLDQRRPGAFPGAGQSRAQAGHTAADYHNVKGLIPPFAAYPHYIHLP